MEKDTGRYRYEPYPQLTKQNNGNTNSLKRDTSKKEPESSSCCKCFGKKKSRRATFLHGCITNLGICILLFIYTLIGSFIFLAIEGGNNVEQQILATTSNQHYKKPFFNTSIELTQINAEARARTVENIWNMTESLNILYKDNWTRLAAQEITRFQDQIIKRLTEQINNQIQPVKQEKSVATVRHEYEWTFAKAFLYSLTVLTTIGYGSIAPRSTLGKAVTMGYAILGIPLTLLYLSSVGSLLSHVARGVFSRALCCCLCSNCGYCCYDEKRMAEKERKMKKKRQQLELQQQLALQEPFYVRSNSGFTSSTTGSTHNNLHSPVRDLKETDSLSCTDNESKTSMHGLSILAPILLCLIIMFCYICVGAFALYKLENWSLLDGFYFCFMSLTTVGFGDMVPGAGPKGTISDESSGTIWFCSMYIMSGMALTAMCFNVVHDEIIHRLKHQERGVKKFHCQGGKHPSNLYNRNMTEETLLSTGTPTSLVDLGAHELVPVNSKMPEVLEGPVMTGVYTLPEEPEIEETGEENTEM